MVTRDFLRERARGASKYAWSGNWTDKGNIHFILWNLLGVFHGHYDVVVNPDTFEYRVKKRGEYGNLVSYLPPREEKVWTRENMVREQIDHIEPIVANTLLNLLYPCLFDKANDSPYSQHLSNLLLDDNTFEHLWILRQRC